MNWDLPLIWAGVLAVAVAMYVILDGFDLGIGILFPYAEQDHERDQMISSIAGCPLNSSPTAGLARRLIRASGKR